MREAFAAIVPWATLAFAVSSMIAVGLGNSVSQILGPLKHGPRVIRAVAANFILAPVLAYLLVRLLALDTPSAVGLFVVGAAAGAPFLLKLAQAADGDVAFAASLLVLLLPLTVVFLPIVLPSVLPEADVAAGAIARPLIFSMLVPLAAGLLLRPFAPRVAARARPLLGKLSSVALVVLLASVVIADWQALLDIGGRAIFAVFSFILVAFAMGWSLGGRDRGTREVIALGTAQRNIAAATVVATQTFADVPGVVVMVTATSVVGMLVLFPIAFSMRRKQPATSARPIGYPRRREA